MASSAKSLSQADYTSEVEIKRPTVAFTPIEWLVIAIAQRDGLKTLREPSRLALALGSLFGSQSHSALADPRLEILRQSAVLAAHGVEMCAADRERFTEAGFSKAHFSLLLASLDRAAVDVSRSRRRAQTSHTRPAPPSERAAPASF